MFTNVTTNAYQDQINAGFSKVCEIFKIRGIETSESFTHRSVIVAPFPRDAERNELWLVVWHVGQTQGRALANECYNTFQTFSRQSEGLATRD